MAAEDKGRWDAALNKQCQYAETRANKAKREAGELISKLKLRAEMEGEFL